MGVWPRRAARAAAESVLSAAQPMHDPAGRPDRRQPTSPPPTRARRPASLWPDSTRPATRPRARASPPTRFDPLAEERARAAGAGRGGLRRLPPGAGAARGAARAGGAGARCALAAPPSAADWGARQAALAFGGVAGTLLWLVTVCALQPAAAPRRRAARVRPRCWPLRRGRRWPAWRPLWWAGWPATGRRPAPGWRCRWPARRSPALLWAWLDLRARHLAAGRTPARGWPNCSRASGRTSCSTR